MNSVTPSIISSEQPSPSFLTMVHGSWTTLSFINASTLSPTFVLLVYYNITNIHAYTHCVYSLNIHCKFTVM